jgi:hypothetical protein
MPVKSGAVFVVVAIIVATDAECRGQLVEPAAQQAISTIEELGGRIYRGANQQPDIIALTGRQVTDAHLPMLQSLPTVRVLDLDNSAVTDAGLKHLLALPVLEEVSLRGTHVTRAAAASSKEHHPAVYRVELSPGFQPSRLVFAAVMLVPLLLGCWLIRVARRKRAFVSPRIYARGLVWGGILVAGAILLMLVAIIQSLGIDFHLADLFG